MAKKPESHVLALTQTKQAALARANADNLLSLEILLSGSVLDLDQPESLPGILMQLSALERVSWAYAARVLKGIRTSKVWEQVEEGKYKGNFAGFLQTYTAASDYTPKKVSNLLVYIDWIDTNWDRIKKIEPKDCKYDSPIIPKERTMKFIMKYQKAFRESEMLLAMIFWDREYNHNILMAEIREVMGEAYIAKNVRRVNRSKSLGGSMPRPNFNPTPANPTAIQLYYAISRASELIFGSNAYDFLSPDQRVEVTKQLESLVKYVRKVNKR